MPGLGLITVGKFKNDTSTEEDGLEKIKQLSYKGLRIVSLT